MTPLPGVRPLAARFARLRVIQPPRHALQCTGDGNCYWEWQYMYASPKESSRAFRRWMLVLSGASSASADRHASIVVDTVDAGTKTPFIWGQARF